jgi:hypothetical protein
VGSNRRLPPRAPGGAARKLVDPSQRGVSQLSGGPLFRSILDLSESGSCSTGREQDQRPVGQVGVRCTRPVLPAMNMCAGGIRKNAFRVHETVGSGGDGPIEGKCAQVETLSLHGSLVGTGIAGSAAQGPRGSPQGGHRLSGSRPPVVTLTRRVALTRRSASSRRRAPDVGLAWPRMVRASDGLASGPKTGAPT